MERRGEHTVQRVCRVHTVVQQEESARRTGRRAARADAARADQGFRQSYIQAQCQHFDCQSL